MAGRSPSPPAGLNANDLVHLLQAAHGALVAALMGLVLFLFASKRLNVDARTSMVAALLGVFATMLLPSRAPTTTGRSPDCFYCWRSMWEQREVAAPR